MNTAVKQAYSKTVYFFSVNPCLLLNHLLLEGAIISLFSCSLFFNLILEGVISQISISDSVLAVFTNASSSLRLVVVLSIVLVSLK